MCSEAPQQGQSTTSINKIPSHFQPITVGKIANMERITPSLSWIYSKLITHHSDSTLTGLITGYKGEPPAAKGGIMKGTALPLAYT